MKKILFTLTCSFLCLSLGFAQPVGGLKPGKKLKIAKEKLAQGDIYNALEWFEKVYEDDKNNKEVISTIADLQYKLRDFKKAEKWYNRLASKDRKGDYPNARFFLGRCMKMNGKYQEAVAEFEKFIESSSDDKLKALASAEITGAEMAAEMSPNEGIELTNLDNVNTSFTDYSPSQLGDDKMFFAAIRSDSIIFTEDGGAKQFSKIYSADKSGDKFSNVQALGNGINESGTHTGNVHISPDGGTMYFTRCYLDGNLLNTCDIYVSTMEGGSWGSAQKVNGINGDAFTSKHPAIGTVGGKQALFFASDRPGTKGGFDIFYAVGSGASFSSPMNAGSSINTVGDEETPFYKDKNLYFSSTGLPGLGGYDVFKSAINGSNFGTPENMGIGVNSRVDDMYYSEAQNGFDAYVVSNREGGKSLKSPTCCDDIWYVLILQDVPLNVLAFDAKSKEELAGTTIEVLNADGDLLFTKTNPVSNDFAFVLPRGGDYTIRATKETYESDEKTVSTKNMGRGKTEPISVDVFLTPPPPPPPPVIVPDPPVIVNRPPLPYFDTIYYDFDKSFIRSDAEVTLNNIIDILKSNPDLVIEVRSHTDALGSNPYNDQLSARRTTSAVQYLLDAGISNGRLLPASFGEAMPVAPNRKANGQDYPEGRQKNRRTEFRIVEYDKSKYYQGAPLRRNTGSIITPSTPSPSGSASISFKKKEFDFGKLTSGDVRTHTFQFTNTGSKDLLIEFVSGSCGCTVPEWPSQPIPPGGTGEIEVKFDSKNKFGEVMNEVTVMSNTSPEITTLRIMAQVEE